MLAKPITRLGSGGSPIYILLEKEKYRGRRICKRCNNERKRWLLFGIPWTFTKYTLTPKRIILNEGLLRSTENEILLYRIIDIELSKTLFQKIFKLGTVTVKSKDASHPILEIKNIKNARAFRDSLAEAVENERLRMKVRQGEVYDPQSIAGSDDDFDDGF